MNSAGYFLVVLFFLSLPAECVASCALIGSFRYKPLIGCGAALLKKQNNKAEVSRAESLIQHICPFLLGRGWTQDSEDPRNP